LETKQKLSSPNSKYPELARGTMETLRAEFGSIKYDENQ